MNMLKTCRKNKYAVLLHDFMDYQDEAAQVMNIRMILKYYYWEEIEKVKK